VHNYAILLALPSSTSSLLRFLVPGVRTPIRLMNAPG
jgi:hypothetical protein